MNKEKSSNKKSRIAKIVYIENGKRKRKWEQRNQATIIQELQKYSRLRTGKGMNSWEVAGSMS